jgi:hypothetical protein
VVFIIIPIIIIIIISTVTAIATLKNTVPYSAFLLKLLTQAEIIFGAFRDGPHLFGRRTGVSVEPAVLQTRDFQFQVVMLDVRYDHTCR